MCSIVSFYSGSLLYLLGMVVHSEQVVQRSRQDEGPEDKSLRHFGAISETEFTEFVVTAQKLFHSFQD